MKEREMVDDEGGSPVIDLGPVSPRMAQMAQRALEALRPPGVPYLEPSADGRLVIHVPVDRRPGEGQDAYQDRARGLRQAVQSALEALAP